MTYKIKNDMFGYYNEMTGIDMIFVVENETQYEQAEQIVREEIDAWGGCDDEDDERYWEGYVEGAERKLKENNINVTIYDKVSEEEEML